MKSFEEIGVNEPLRRAIGEMGFETPMPIQERVIPRLLGDASDIIALAQTGTGKTAAFGLPLLQRVNHNDRRPQALVLAPTRELCLQIGSDLVDYSRYLPGIKILPVYGGSSIESQIRSLRTGVNVIVATPGRLIDLINRGVVKLDDINTVVLDEADEMLNMGFLDSIEEILAHVPENHKTLLFSATMPTDILKIAKRYMREYEEIVVGSRNEGAENVRHIYYMVNARDKYLALKRVVDNSPGIYAIMFCRTRRDTQEIADSLIRDGYNAEALHGDLSQQQRDIVMKKFRDRVVPILVATDVAARGLDVSDLTHVINYGLPEDTAVYTHRSGRTGRAGKKGVSIAIIHSREKSRLREIERTIGKTFEHLEVPSPEHIIEKQLYNLADRIERVKVNEEEIARYLPGISRKLEWLSEQDLLKRVISLEFNRLIDYYKDAPAIDFIDTKPERKRKGEKAGGRGEKAGGRGDKANGNGGRGDKAVHDRPANDKEKDRRTAAKGMERIYVNVGKRDGFFAGNLIELLNREVHGKRVDVGRIDLLPAYTLFDVNKKDARKVVGALTGTDFFGKHLHSEIADPERDYSHLADKKKKQKAH